MQPHHQAARILGDDVPETGPVRDLCLMGDSRRLVGGQAQIE
jgi:hypothetical protein